MVNHIRIGIIGLGHIATNAHIPAIKKINEAELVAVADIDTKKLHSAERKLGKSVKFFADYREMLEQPDLDMVTICLPPHMHVRATRQALEANKHVLVEKPLATSLEGALEIVKLSKKFKRKVCVVQNYRYFPAVMEAKKRVLEGLIGNILCINTITYIPPPTVSASKAWIYGRWGILDDYGPHPIDMTNWIASSAPLTVYCICGSLRKATSLTDARLMITYDDETMATIGMSWLAGVTKFELTITGTAGEIMLNVNLNQLTEHHGTITPYHQIKDFLNLTKRNLKNILDGTIFKGSYIYHVPLLHEFIKSIAQDTEPPITLTESLRNVAISEGAKISLSEGKIVNLKELLKSDYSFLRE
jgi:UDP-N-acetylglucosamine 3-dehydrogenase